MLGAKVIKMHILDLTPEKIAANTDLSIEEVKEVINETENEGFTK